VMIDMMMMMISFNLIKWPASGIVITTQTRFSHQREFHAKIR